MNRKDTLLLAAYDLIKRADLAPCVEETLGIEVRYDNANCDGFCLMSDIADELGLPEFDSTDPIPLEDEDE